MRRRWVIILIVTDTRLLVVVALLLRSEDPVLSWTALRRLIDDVYRGPCETFVGVTLSFDIQFEHGVHRHLIIVEEGVFLTTAHRSRYPFHFPRWYDWEAPLRCFTVARCQRLGYVIWEFGLRPYSCEVFMHVSLTYRLCIARSGTAELL